ncbi:MAG: S8 family serine peptidase [Pseudomonadota bacterium]
MEIPKVNFNTLKSGLGTGISGKLEAQVASAGEKFHFAIRSSCEGSQSVESLKDYGDVILTSQPSNQRFLFGQLILSGPYPYTELKQAWQKIGCLETIETSKSFELAALPSDQLFDRQDYLEIIGFHASYPIWQERMQRLNEDIIVAVIDSGVDLDHSDLIGNIWTNSGEVPGDGIDNDNNGLIDDINGYNFEARNGDPDPADGDPFDNYHGTAVAGLIAAAANGSGLVGVSPFGTKIMSLNVFADQNVASPDNIAAAIVYATNLGAKVINMSLTGAADSSVLLLAIENAIANGATVVSAAGSFGARISGSEEFTPGSYASDQEGAINVGALNTRDNSLALFSNRSSDFVEIAAPGSYAYSLALRRGIATLQVEDGYTESSGTSFAAPLVSGAAALVYGLYNDRYGQFPSAAEVENLIKSSGTPYKHLSGDVEGCKTLNILNLVNSI